MSNRPYPDEPLTILELDALMRALERLPHTGDFRFDQAIGLAHDRLLMMWAEARRAADTALDGANLPPEDEDNPRQPKEATKWKS